MRGAAARSYGTVAGARFGKGRLWRRFPAREAHVAAAPVPHRYAVGRAPPEFPGSPADRAAAASCRSHFDRTPDAVVLYRPDVAGGRAVSPRAGCAVGAAKRAICRGSPSAERGAFCRARFPIPGQPGTHANWWARCSPARSQPGAGEGLRWMHPAAREKRGRARITASSCSPHGDMETTWRRYAPARPGGSGSQDASAASERAASWRACGSRRHHGFLSAGRGAYRARGPGSAGQGRIASATAIARSTRQPGSVPLGFVLPVIPYDTHQKPLSVADLTDRVSSPPKPARALAPPTRGRPWLPPRTASSRAILPRNTTLERNCL